MRNREGLSEDHLCTVRFDIHSVPGCVCGENTMSEEYQCGYSNRNVSTAEGCGMRGHVGIFNTEASQ